MSRVQQRVAVRAPSDTIVPDDGREFEFSDADFVAIAELAHEQAGIVLARSKRNLVYSRVSRRLRALGLNSFRQYRDLLASGSPGELEAFVNAISTNLTKFFRESHHFDHFGADVLAPFAKAKSGSGRLRIWSAGCSTGEEPYTLALLINSVLAKRSGGQDVRVLATDIDTEVLKRASEAIYPRDALEALPSQYRDAWRDEEQGKGAFKSELRELITFGRLNLLQDWPIRGPFDAIFCRNVMIYFDQPTKTRLVDRFIGHIKIGGFLYIGHSESLVGSHSQLKAVGRTIYQRVS